MDAREAKLTMEELHEGVCGSHMNGHMLMRKILHTRYYWLTMEANCTQLVRKCATNAKFTPIESMHTERAIFHDFHMAIVFVGQGCYWSYHPQSFEWSPFYFCCHRLFYRMGRGCLLWQSDKKLLLLDSSSITLFVDTDSLITSFLTMLVISIMIDEGNLYSA